MSSYFPSDVLFESFTFPFFDFAFHADHGGLAKAFMDQPDPNPDRGRRGLYVHIPFCETICEMCPFVKSVGSEERIREYLDALQADVVATASTPRAQSWTIDAIYVGGGTPSVLSPDDASRLLDCLRGSFNVRTNAEVTFEVEAKSASVELLKAVSEAGATRISFGIQTLDPKLRDIVNLTATIDDIQRTISTGNDLFSDVNVDMIVGFPGQSTTAAVRDLELAADLGATSMSLYPMDYVTVLPKLLNRMRSGQLPRPAAQKERWKMFHEGRKVLSNYYNEQNMYCFGQRDLQASDYMFGILYGGYHDQYIGLGASAYTSLSGAIFHKFVSEEQYVHASLSGSSTVQRTSPGHGYEKELVFFPKRLSVDLCNLEDLGIERFYRPRIDELVESGWATQNGTVVTLAEDGKAHYYRLMVGFLMDEQRRLYDGACQRLSRNLGLSADGDLLDNPAVAKGMGTAISLNAGKTRGMELPK